MSLPQPGHEAPDGWVYLGSGMWVVPQPREGCLPVASRAGFVHGVLDVAALEVPEAGASDAEWGAWAARALDSARWLREPARL